MFNLRKGTVIAEGLKIVGSVTAEGLVEVNGHLDGDLYCTSLVISPKACINGGIQAQRIVVNGKVEGPICGAVVILKSHAVVRGDIETESLSIERGAHFEGRSKRTSVANMPQVEVESPDDQPVSITQGLHDRDDLRRGSKAIRASS
jgi:cytoskeletal protein CcmA (bactofilin family)